MRFFGASLGEVDAFLLELCEEEDAGEGNGDVGFELEEERVSKYSIILTALASNASFLHESKLYGYLSLLMSVFSNGKQRSLEHKCSIIVLIYK